MVSNESKLANEDLKLDQTALDGGSVRQPAKDVMVNISKPL